MTTEAPAAPEAQASEPDERLAYRGPIQRLLTRPEIGALIGSAVIWVFFWAVSDVFGTAAGTQNYLDVATSFGIMSVAVALLMIGGEFDLSSGAMTGATGMLVVLLVKDVSEFGGFGLPLTVGIPATLAFAIGIGWVNGTLVEKTALPSFIVTLATFFALRGAKLGFAKLFTDKVIVEGLDDAPDFEFWDNIFGAEWTRNDHLWDSALWGRDVVVATLALVGAGLVIFGLLEMGFRRKATYDQAGLGVMVTGLVVTIFGLSGIANFTDGVGLTRTDSVGENFIYSIVMAVGIIIAVYGAARWRYQERLDGGSSGLPEATRRNVIYGGAAIAAGVIVGILMDAGDGALLFGDGFRWTLLTRQGLRAILFSGGVIVGLMLMVLAIRQAKESPRAQLNVTALTAAVIVVLAFIVQSEGDSRKFRAELFAWMLLGALLLLTSGILARYFLERTDADPPADRFGRRLSIVGVSLGGLAIAIRLLYTTTSELEGTRGVITFRISLLYFILFAGAASYVLLKTRFGSWTFAVGGNASASRQVGVPTARTKTRLFMLVSVAAWLVGMLVAFRLNSVQANVGDGNEFFYIIAAVVGGNLLTGGYGSVLGAAIGAIIMAMSFQGIPFASWNSDWRFLFVGAILLLAVLVNNYVRSRAEKA